MSTDQHKSGDEQELHTESEVESSSTSEAVETPLQEDSSYNKTAPDEKFEHTSSDTSSIDEEETLHNTTITPANNQEESSDAAVADQDEDIPQTPAEQLEPASQSQEEQAIAQAETEPAQEQEAAQVALASHKQKQDITESAEDIPTQSQATTDEYTSTVEELPVALHSESSEDSAVESEQAEDQQTPTPAFIEPAAEIESIQSQAQTQPEAATQTETPGETSDPQENNVVEAHKTATSIETSKESTQEDFAEEDEDEKSNTEKLVVVKAKKLAAPEVTPTGIDEIAETPTTALHSAPETPLATEITDEQAAELEDSAEIAAVQEKAEQPEATQNLRPAKRSKKNEKHLKQHPQQMPAMSSKPQDMSPQDEDVSETATTQLEDEATSAITKEPTILLAPLEVKEPAEQYVSTNSAVSLEKPADYETRLPASFTDDYISRKDLQRWQRHRKVVVHHISRKHMRTARNSKKQATNRLWVSVFTTLMAMLVVFLSLTGASSFVAYQFYNTTQSQFTNQIINLPSLLPKDNLKIYDSKGVLLYQLVDQGMHTSVTFDQIPDYVVEATVSTEDKNFWSNPGFDPARIFQAALEDLKANQSVQGGSTITQQLIKKLVVGDSENLQRKLQEVTLTPIVNQHYSKKDIMEMYLNTVFYGEQANGIDAAANAFFDLHDKPGKPAAAQLDLAQSAMLAGLISGPSLHDPFYHPQAASDRFDYVINRMVQDKYITKVQAEDAAREAHSKNFFKHPTNLQNLAPHFVYFVMSQLESAFHLTQNQLSRSDMSVHTTLDLSLQNKIQKIAQQDIAAIPAYLHVTNAAEVLIDYHTGAVKTLLGSLDYNNKAIDGQYDVATQGYRQPGSSFKPYVYATAFEHGISPAQAINDSPLTINIPGSESFTPNNYDNKYHGQLTIRCALQTSLNIPAVKTLQHVGINAALKTAEDMGIGNNWEGTPGYSMVLGSLDVHLIDHTSSYGTFANGGVHVPYYTIQSVDFVNEHHTYNHPTNTGKRVLTPQIAYMMTNVLSDDASRINEFGHCDPLQLYSSSQNDCWAGNPGSIRPAAAKTGTSNDFRDNLTVGYTSDYVMGVWAGNSDNSPMQTGVTGIVGAAPIWHDSMLEAEKGHPIRDFQNPGGLELQNVTYADGVHSTDLFLSGSTPSTSTPAGDNQMGNAMISENDMQLNDMQLFDPGRKQPNPIQSRMPAWCPTFNYQAPSYGAPPAW